jgi:hypothetical protein
MRRLLALVFAVLVVVTGTGCDSKTDSHEGHDHKPGEKHDH